MITRQTANAGHGDLRETWTAYASLVHHQLCCTLTVVVRDGFEPYLYGVFFWTEVLLIAYLDG